MTSIAYGTLYAHQKLNFGSGQYGSFYDMPLPLDNSIMNEG